MCKNRMTNKNYHHIYTYILFKSCKPLLEYYDSAVSSCHFSIMCVCVHACMYACMCVCIYITDTPLKIAYLETNIQ